MEWLLTLFAMLGAVTGASAGVRGEEAQLHRAEASAAVRAAAAAAETIVVRADPALPANVPAAAAVRTPAPAPAIPAIPLYLDRPLE